VELAAFAGRSVARIRLIEEYRKRFRTLVKYRTPWLDAHHSSSRWRFSTLACDQLLAPSLHEAVRPLRYLGPARALDELAAHARRLLRRSFHAQVEPASDSTANVHKMAESGAIAGICLECAAIFGHQPLTVRCRLGAIQE